MSASELDSRAELVAEIRRMRDGITAIIDSAGSDKRHDGASAILLRMVIAELRRLINPQAESAQEPARKAYTREEIEAHLSRNGSTRASLAALGVKWPPKKGWKIKLQSGENPNA